MRVVEELLDSRLVPRFAVLSSSVEDSPRGRALAERLEAACPVERVRDAELSALAETETTQGVLAVAETPKYEIDELVVTPRDVVLVLDAIQDPGNAGTLIRTADALGARAVLTLPGTVDVWNPKVVRSAAGSLFRMPVIDVDVERVRQWAAQHGALVLAGDAAGRAIDDVAVRGPALVVVGNEGAGLSDETSRLATSLVSIPIRGSAESLNVGVAAGILLYEVTRRIAAGAT